MAAPATADPTIRGRRAAERRRRERRLPDADGNEVEPNSTGPDAAETESDAAETGPDAAKT